MLSGDASRRFERLKAETASVSAATPIGSTRQLPAKTAGKTKTPVTLRLVLWRVLKIVALAILPFLILLRGAVFFHHRFGFHHWLALVAAALITTALLTAYAAKISRLLTGRRQIRFIATRIIAPAVVGYCGFSLLYLSSTNVKNEDERQYFTSVHPLLRLGLSTAILADRDMVITDMYRVPEDYDGMGLPVYERSLHFRQPDGYVHAVDLRTIGRAEWSNLAIVAYFRAMGFRTLRHVGTADHLHISLRR